MLAPWHSFYERLNFHCVPTVWYRTNLTYCLMVNKKKGSLFFA
jgi:hypothetical protein